MSDGAVLAYLRHRRKMLTKASRSPMWRRMNPHFCTAFKGGAEELEYLIRILKGDPKPYDLHRSGQTRR